MYFRSTFCNLNLVQMSTVFSKKKFFFFSEGYQKEKRIFDETDWTNVSDKKVLPYHRSKTEAERAAWKFVKDEKGMIKKKSKLIYINIFFFCF